MQPLCLHNSPFPQPRLAVTRPSCSLFVRFLHMASPYVAGHRGRTFVVVIPGEVVGRKERLYPLLEGEPSASGCCCCRCCRCCCSCCRRCHLKHQAVA